MPPKIDSGHLRAKAAHRAALEGCLTREAMEAIAWFLDQEYRFAGVRLESPDSNHTMVAGEMTAINRLRKSWKAFVEDATKPKSGHPA